MEGPAPSIRGYNRPFTEAAVKSNWRIRLYRGSFAVSKRGIYYMSYPDEAGISSLKLYSFATKSSSTILQMGRPEYGLDVSPDGRYLAYAQLDDSASDLMLVENFQ